MLRDNSAPFELAERLRNPQAPDGTPITHQHPLLVFFAENGSIPPTESVEKSQLIMTTRSVGKSTKSFREYFAYATYVMLDPAKV